MSTRETVLWLVIGFVAFVCLVLGGCSVACVPAGHVAITTSFGQVDGVIDEGMTLIKPWKKTSHLPVRTQEIKETAYVPTKEGLTVTMEATLLFRLNKDKAADIYRKVGPDYAKVIVENQFRSAMRDATVNFEAKDLYTANRELVEQKLFTIVSSMVSEYGIVVEAVRLRDIQLPQVVSDRISAKLAAEQDNQRMIFVKQKTQQEADIRVIEAEGIAKSQMIIKKDLSHEYLVYIWIQALQEHAKHGGSTIYIPTGSDGLPFFKQVK
jgi:regulator of protease activity HflC (stomatin/prohibitin superfamily)